MSNFEQAMYTIFFQEGRFSNDKADPGGATDYGISLRFLRSIGDLDKDGYPDGDINRDGDINVEDIRALDKTKAKDLYHRYFWLPNRYSEIADQRCATKIFSLAVSIGSMNANEVAQVACRATIGLQLYVDGVMGLKSITALNMANPDVLYAVLKMGSACFYQKVRLKDGNERKYIKGWLNRAYSEVITNVS